jgi:hypothetical protein
MLTTSRLSALKWSAGYGNSRHQGVLLTAHYDARAGAAACRNRRQAAGSLRRQRVRQRSGESSRAQVGASVHHGRAWPSGTMTLDDEDLFGDHVPERAPKAAGKAA